MIDEIGRLRMDFIFENNKYPNRMTINIDTGFKILKESRHPDKEHMGKIAETRNVKMMKELLSTSRLYSMSIIIDDTVTEPILEKVEDITDEELY